MPGAEQAGRHQGAGAVAVVAPQQGQQQTRNTSSSARTVPSGITIDSLQYAWNGYLARLVIHRPKSQDR
jgi:hypothetical protein